MPDSPSVEPLHTYEGFDNLQAMRKAVRYNAYLTSLVLTGVKPGTKALDFGAGLGDVARAVRDRGAEVACVEPDRGMRLALARAGFPTFQFLDQVAQGSVEFLYSLNVLEHIEDDVGTLYIHLRRAWEPALTQVVSALDELELLPQAIVAKFHGETESYEVVRPDSFTGTFAL